MTPTAYLERAGLESSPELVSSFLPAYQHLLHATTLPADITSLYSYRVPELGENGACSLPHLLADEPYDLAATLGGVQEHTSLRLAALYALVRAVAGDTGCGWLGIYQARDVADGRALVKLAYVGKPSRAEFPLSAEFAAHSNNSTVGLSGKARLIDSVDAYLAEGGAYYTCDGAVQSEACLPLFDASGALIGIIDAEDSRPGYFQGEVLARLVALCLVAAQGLP